jgi:hypothetical protein
MEIADHGFMGLTFLTGYILGQHGVQSARVASSASVRSGASVNDIEDLNDRVDRLILVVDAMWSLLEEGGFSDVQLRRRIAEIDRQDGKEDGKRRDLAATCTSCGSKVPVGRATCQFCGADAPIDEDQSPLSGI